MADLSLPGDEDLAPRKSGRGRLIAAVAIVVFGGAAGFFIRRSMLASERTRTLNTASTAWRSLSRCLAGDAPLAAGEEVTWRVHRIELAREPVAPDAGDAVTAGAWPYRCAPFATSLRDALRAVSSADAPQRRLASLAERTRAELVLGRPGTLRPPEGQPAPLDELFAAALAAHLPPPGAPAGPPPPTPAAGVLTRAELRPLFATRADVETQVVSGDRTPGQGLRVLVSHGNLFGCRFHTGGDAASELATARCEPVTTEPIASLADVTLFDSDDDFEGFPPVRVGSGPAVRLFGLPGATGPQPRPFAFRGAIARDGTVTYIDSNSQELDAAASTGHWRLNRQRGAAAAYHGALTLPEESSRPDFVTPDRVVYLASSEPGHGPARVGLFARPLADRPNPLGAPVDAGDVPENSRIVARCRTTQGPAVAVSAEGAVQLTLAGADRWGAPARVEDHSRMLSLACSADSATATWVDAHSPMVHQIRCTPTGCTPTEARVGSLTRVFGRPADRVQIADLGGRVLVVWSPEEGGIRMRLAPLNELDAARDVVLYDAHTHRGGWVTGVSLFARRNAAVVVFIDDEQDGNRRRPFAIRIDSTGGFRAVAPEG